MAEEWDEEYGQIPYYARGFALQRVPVSQIASPFINPIRQERIDELAELEDEGHELPPVILDGPGEVEEVDYPEEKYPFLDGHYPVVGEDVWYAHDGHHRVTLAIQRGQRFIDALIIGTSNEMERNGPSPLDNPAFRRWFGASKVVDENGQPLVVYHGTRGDFDVFSHKDIGFHFGSAAQAVTRLRDTGPLGHGRRGMPGGKLVPVYLSIKNPLLILDAGDWSENSIGLSNVLTDMVVDDDSFADAYEKASDAPGVETYVDIFRHMGHDGLVYDNVGEGGGMSWIAFDPWQIKSATDNVGTYDPADPSILRNPGSYPDAFIIVHLSSLGSLAWQGGGEVSDDLLSSLSSEAHHASELDRKVIVIDQGWPGRVENRARREIKEAAPGAIWVHHDEDEDGWDDFESSFPRLLREAGIRSAKIGGLWLDGCVDHVSKIVSAAGVEAMVDGELSVSYCDLETVDEEEDDEDEA